MIARARLRDLGIKVGALPTGAFNAITDVAGVRGGYSTLISDAPPPTGAFWLYILSVTAYGVLSRGLLSGSKLRWR